MSKWLGVLTCLCLLVFLTVSNAVGETLFYDDFEDGVISDAWAFSEEDLPQGEAGKPEWVEENGVLKQTSEKTGDPAHAVIMDQQYPELITIQAKVRVDSWPGGDAARSGLVLRVGKDSGCGYGFLFHADQSTIQFLNDWITWGDSATYDFEIGSWYWMQFHIDADKVLHGKVWKDGETEPDEWMLEQAQADLGAERPWKDGYPGLCGGSSDGWGNTSSTSSFDDAEVWDEGGRTPGITPVKPAGKISITWAKVKTE